MLAQTCLPTEVLSKFSVKVVNVQSGASLITVQQIVVDLKDNMVSMLKSQTNWVVVSNISKYDSLDPPLSVYKSKSWRP